MDLNQLRQLVEIAKCGTISKASEELLISQPALSRSMKKLEEDINVTLFERYANKVILNPNGELLVAYAKKILDEIDDLVAQVQAYDKAHLIIKMACCAPAPLWDLEKEMTNLYPHAKCELDIIDETTLLQELKNGSYQLVLTPFKTNDEDVVCYPYINEDLYISLPPNHPLKRRKSVSFQDIDGEMIILYSNIGFWYNMHLKTTPNAKFLIQNERSTFNEIVKASTLPSFTSNLSIKREGNTPNRVIIPISDKEAHVTFYLTLLKKHRNQFIDLITKIKPQ